MVSLTEKYFTFDVIKYINTILNMLYATEKDGMSRSLICVKYFVKNEN